MLEIISFGQKIFRPNLVLFLFLWLHGVHEGRCQIKDLTMVNENSLVRKGEISFIKCVSDEVELGHGAFRRDQDTGSGSRLAPMHLIGPISPEEWPGKRLSMYPDDDLNRTGVYSCEGKDPNTHIMTKIKGIKIGTSGGVWPDFFTYTASVEDKDFTVKFKSFDPTSEVVWKYRGHVIGGSPADRKLIRTFSSVTTQQAGIYECFKPPENRNVDLSKYRPLDQGIMRLIVRSCPSHKWGFPRCDKHCTCINGGICDHDTGFCVCPPGFRGKNCETSCGGNRFGFTCQHHCKQGGKTHGADAEECGGRHFCLQDPYGCSCATGFSGLECTNGCGSGQFGADCKQVCHCKRPDLCNRFTGVCTMGCASGWKGTSCQIGCDAFEWGDNCQHKCNCAGDVECDSTTGACPGGRCKQPFTGDSCQIDSLDECSSNPCKHDGDCIDDVFSYKCKCLNGTTGVHCETDLNDCESSPCLNDGTCEDIGVGQFTCHCPGGFRGKTCEENIDDCERHKCENDAECVDDIMTYVCECRSGYIGRFCAEICSEGTFHNKDEDTCFECHKNWYQELAGQAECKPCPDGLVTLHKGSSHITQCISSSAGAMQPLVMVASGLGGILVLICVGVGLWYWWTHKSSTRLEHLGPGRSAW